MRPILTMPEACSDHLVPRCFSRLGLLVFIWLAAAGAPGSVRAGVPDSEIRSFIDEQYAFAAAQYKAMLAALEGESRFPRSFEKDRLVLVGPRDWTSGFFPGSLWLLFEHTGDPVWREAAAQYTQRLKPVQSYNGTHDLGFMLYCSFGNGYRLSSNAEYRDVLVAGARTLAGRFHPEVGLIRSWDWGTWKYPVIIDNMMNLELLMFAAKETGEERFRDIAVSHANRTLTNHFRPDFSSYHLVDYDPATGAVLKKETRQGFSDSSAWARGQAWGLYGYTSMYRLTTNGAYLSQAQHIAEFLVHHSKIPRDGIPYWDLDAPGIPNEPRDASSAAIMASALLELRRYVGAEVAAQYREFALRQLRSLASPEYRATPGGNGHFLLKHCVGDKPRNGEVDAPLVYADYYYLEALSRLE